MININKQFLAGYTPPEIATLGHRIGSLGAVKKYLKSKQQIHLTPGEMDELVKDESFWFYKSDAEFYDRIEAIDDLTAGYDFSDVTNFFGISEYVGVFERYLPFLPYLQYAKLNNEDILMNVYDAYSLYNISRRSPLLRDKIKGHLQLTNQHDPSRQKELPEFDFQLPEVVQYTHFIEKRYDREVSVSSFQDPIQMLSINLPYDFYSHQPLPPNIYNWDIDKEEHVFGGMNSSAFISLLNEVCENGIQTPLFLRMNGEILSSNNIETNLMLFIAKLLKLPSIPVTFYLSNEDVGKNHLIDAVINYTPKRRSFFGALSSMNHLLEPYLVLNKPDQLLELPDHYQVENYQVFSADELITVRYLSTEPTDDQLKEPIDKSSEEHEKLKDEAISSLDNNVDRMIQELLGNKSGESLNNPGGE